MGNGMMCATTQKSWVAQGDANTPKNSCATTTSPKRGGGGGGAGAKNPIDGSPLFPIRQLGRA